MHHTAPLLYALGLDKEDLEKPIIGIACSANDIVPGHKHLNQICEEVKTVYIVPGVHL